MLASAEGEDISAAAAEVKDKEMQKDAASLRESSGSEERASIGSAKSAANSTAANSTAATTAAGCGDWSISTNPIAAGFPDSASDSSGSRALRPRPEVINWSTVRLGHRIEPYAGYAHSASDVYLFASFLELAELEDIEGEAVKLMLRTIKFLNLCDYSVEDICSILAHASAYFLDAYSLCGHAMDTSEVGNVLACLTFIAHCYMQDETCPLNIWHQHLFRKYCPLKTLNAAVMRLLQIRGFRLRLEEEDLQLRFKTLLQAAHTTRQQRLSNASSSEPVSAELQQRLSNASSAEAVSRVSEPSSRPEGEPSRRVEGASSAPES